MAIALVVACAGEARAQATAPAGSTPKSAPTLDRRLIVVAFDAPDTLSFNILARAGRDSARVVGTLHFANPSFAPSRSDVTASSLEAAIPILACGLVADTRLR